MLTGWKEISQFTGRSRGTILKMAKKDGFPLLTYYGRPTTTKRAIERWFKGHLKEKASAYQNLSKEDVRGRLLVL